MDAFDVQPCQAAVFAEHSAVYIHCCEVYYEVSFTVASLQCLKLNAVFLHISFLESPSVRRMCVYIPRSDSILEKLAGLNSPCIVHVKSSVVVKVGIQLYLNVFKILLFDYAFMHARTQGYKSLSQVSNMSFNF
jgi:hypothetical protein